MADVLKYGWVTGGRQGTEMPVDHGESYNRNGGAFVTASGTTGLMRIIRGGAAGSDVVVGWAEVPRAPVPGLDAYWTSHETLDDKVLVIHDPTAIFAMPVSETGASLSASLVGRFVAATVSGSGTSLVQKVDATATAVAEQQQFFVTGVDLDNRIAFVRINPHHVA